MAEQSSGVGAVKLTTMREQREQERRVKEGTSPGEFFAASQ